MVLDKLRNKINNIDNKLISLLGERAKLSAEVARFKKKHKLPIMSLKREKEIISRTIELARSKKVSKDLAKKIIQLIIEDSKKIQRRMLR